MANLTLSIDERLLRSARIRALQQGTSLNALVREYLEAFAGHTRAPEAVASFLERTAAPRASSGPHGRRWRRDELYDR